MPVPSPRIRLPLPPQHCRVPSPTMAQLASAPSSRERTGAVETGSGSASTAVEHGEHVASLPGRSKAEIWAAVPIPRKRVKRPTPHAPSSWTRAHSSPVSGSSTGACPSASNRPNATETGRSPAVVISNERPACSCVVTVRAVVATRTGPSTAPSKTTVVSEPQHRATAVYSKGPIPLTRVRPPSDSSTVGLSGESKLPTDSAEPPGAHRVSTSSQTSRGGPSVIVSSLDDARGQPGRSATSVRRPKGMSSAHGVSLPMLATPLGLGGAAGGQVNATPSASVVATSPARCECRVVSGIDPRWVQLDSAHTRTPSSGSPSSSTTTTRCADP